MKGYDAMTRTTASATARLARLAGLAATAVLGVVGLAACSSGGSTPSSSSGASSAASASRSSSAASPSQSSSSASPSQNTSSDNGSSGSATKTATITIKDFAYSGPATVSAGTKITIKNQDSTAHTVTSKQGGAFDVMVPGSGSATFTAPKAGTYAFICLYHSNMMGTLKVG